MLFLTTLFDMISPVVSNAGIPFRERFAMSSGFLVCDVCLDRPSHGSVITERGRFAELARLLHQQASIFHASAGQQVEAAPERVLLSRDGARLGSIAIYEAPMHAVRTPRVAVEFCEGEMTYERLAAILDGYAMRVAGGIDVPWAGCPARSVISMPPGGFNLLCASGLHGAVTVDIVAALSDGALFRLRPGEASVSDGNKVYAAVLVGEVAGRNEISAFVVDGKGRMVGGDAPFEHALCSYELEPIGIDEVDSLLAVISGERSLVEHDLAYCVPPHLAHLRPKAEVVVTGHETLPDGRYNVVAVATPSGVAFESEDPIRVEAPSGLCGTVPARMVASAQRDFVIELVVEP